MGWMIQTSYVYSFVPATNCWFSEHCKTQYNFSDIMIINGGQTKAIEMGPYNYMCCFWAFGAVQVSMSSVEPFKW